MPTKLKTDIRTDHENRLNAFDAMQALKKDGLTRKEIISKIFNEFSVPPGTLYDWYKNKYLPYGRRETIIYKPELFYVLGALLGDGCLYKWRTTNHYVILVGDKLFTRKYANILTSCTGKKAASYIDRSKNVFFVRINNYALYGLFERSRKDIYRLENIIRQYGMAAILLFIEGFFDAEGCVKIIKEKSRNVPKICLDVTNTNLAYLELIKKFLKDGLNIEAMLSVQKPATPNRKTAYHLRIYKKEYVKKFLENIKTTKLKKEKIPHVRNWLTK